MTDQKLKPAPLAYENEPFLNSPDGRILRILAEYSEPLARFRRERIQDTVVFFGSARFRSRSDAQYDLELLEKPMSMQPAPPHEQPNAQIRNKKRPDDLQIKRARAALEMAHYYEDARRLAHMLTDWSSK